MFRKNFIYLILILVLPEAGAQYISEVLEYRPAPGQFTNTAPWGSPVARESITGRRDGSMSLGAFGGYVIFRFDGAVENDPGNPFGVDFTILGNPTPYWSEPGIVCVMEDANYNGLPDDTWYELAGSDRWFSTTVPDYRVTYRNPGDGAARDVPWSDNRGDSGMVRTNSAHTQPYYPARDSFPDIPVEEYTLSGTLIAGFVDAASPPMIWSVGRVFGYADNRERGDVQSLLPDNPYTPEVEHSGGDAFDIDWAVDSAGSYVDLDSIHFIKVQTAMMDHGGWLGEVSTEITGAIDVAPDGSIKGATDLIVIRDLPPVINVPEFRLEVFVFRRGRLQEGSEIRWEVELADGDGNSPDPGASVDEANMLTLGRSGTVTLTAFLVEDPAIRTTVTATVQLGSTSVSEKRVSGKEFYLYPNPATDLVFIAGPGAAGWQVEASVYDITGRCRMHFSSLRPQVPLEIDKLTHGIYVIEIRGEGVFSRQRFVKY
jgi:hypothetical protein